jgi:DNA polymerase II large subunit
MTNVDHWFKIKDIFYRKLMKIAKISDIAETMATMPRRQALVLVEFSV